MKNSQKGFASLILLLIIAVVAIGGGAYVYTKNNSVGNKNITSSKTPDELVNESNPNNSNPNYKNSSNINATVRATVNMPSVLNKKDYVIRYIPAEKLSNTLRFQFYGPAKIEGYDSKGNLVKFDTSLSPCRGKNCTTESKLRMDITMQGFSPGDKPLVSVSLDSVYNEYKKWLSEGKTTSFISSVITVKLPTPPPSNRLLDFAGWSSYIGTVYYDNDKDNINNPLVDWNIANTDEIRYSTGRDDVPKDFVNGWNFWRTTGVEPADIKNNPVKNMEFRKSFENQISLIPILGTQQPSVLLSPDKPTPITSTSIIDDKNKKIKTDMLSVLSGLNIIESFDSSYANACKDGFFDLNSTNGKYIEIQVNNLLKDTSPTGNLQSQSSVGIRCYSTKDSVAYSIKLIPGGSDGNASFCVSENNTENKIYNNVGVANAATYSCSK